MDAHTYRDRVEQAVLDEGYEPFDAGPVADFEPVWHDRTEDPTIGVTDVFVTVAEAADIDASVVADTAESFRGLLTDASPADPGSMQNLFGYVVFPVADPDPSLVEFATEEYTVADRRTSVFPLIYDLNAETLNRHDVPRLKGRGFYEKQRLDADTLFDV